MATRAAAVRRPVQGAGAKRFNEAHLVAGHRRESTGFPQPAVLGFWWTGSRDRLKKLHPYP
ncbi:hypothetical protein [Polaromonas sp.]|uniref:hypothetical protein n=1 Tax=Polaromonas sp. TaxID=1869339 RepID=UPI003BB6399C